MLSQEQILQIQECQPLAIKAKTMVPSQLALAYANKWFNIWVPKVYGGLELPLAEGISFLEELAYWDGGLGWTITLCSGANMFSGYLKTDAALSLFSNPETCFGGSGSVGGKAVWDGDKYHISGLWHFATGAPHLTHFTLNCPIFHGDKQQYTDDGAALYYSFYVPREQVLIHYDWETFGLECTASHSFSLDNVSVSQDQAFQILPESRLSDRTLFKIPFKPFAELTLLVNYMGMYRRFLDLVEKYYFEKAQLPEWAARSSKEAFRVLDKYQQQLGRHKLEITTLATALWAAVESDEQSAVLEIVDKVSVLAKAIAQGIYNEIIQLYPQLGIRAATPSHELNIVFRNIFTASQHAIFRG